MNTYPYFLELLRSALWNYPADSSGFEDLGEGEWKDIMQYAVRQRLAALIADGISSLPPELRPPKSIYIHFLLLSEKIEEANRKINEELLELVKIYGELDIPFVLLKGQGNAFYYPRPLHRTPGDLDLFLYRKGDYEKAKRWVIARNYVRESETALHLGYNREDIHIENHRYITRFDRRKYNRILASKIKEITDKEGFEEIRINGEKIRVLPVEMNAFFIFQHMFHHFVYEGVGFRQLCDWILLLNARGRDMDRERFTAMAEEFGLMRAMRVFAHIAVKYMGARPAVFPFELGPDNKFSELVMADILAGGHFGRYRPGKKDPDSLWGGRWNRYKKTVIRMRKFVGMAPSHIRFLPFARLWIRMKLTLKHGRK